VSHRSPSSTPRAPRVDAHLDLAFNAVALGRELDRDLLELRAREARPRQTGMVTWPELELAGIDLVFATLFANPAERVPMQEGALPPPYPEPEGYRDADGAFAQAWRQLEYYEELERRGRIRIVRHRPDLGTLLADGAPIGVMLLMEGADPIRLPDELPLWWARGVRMVGPAWQRTRYAGGTQAPGPLTDLGRELLDAMAALGMALDVSHLADEAAAEALERFAGPVAATHSNARALVPTDRHLSDELLAAIAARDGVVGLVLGDTFLDADCKTTGRRVGLDHLRAHAEHVGAIVGWERLGIGSDLDGGFGAEETLVELPRLAEFGRLAEAAPPEHRDDLLGASWWRWLERALPAADEAAPAAPRSGGRAAGG
jgi:membrane dipeptidase